MIVFLGFLKARPPDKAHSERETENLYSRIIVFTRMRETMDAARYCSRKRERCETKPRFTDQTIANRVTQCNEIIATLRIYSKHIYFLVHSLRQCAWPGLLCLVDSLFCLHCDTVDIFLDRQFSRFSSSASSSHPSSNSNAYGFEYAHDHDL